MRLKNLEKHLPKELEIYWSKSINGGIFRRPAQYYKTNTDHIVSKHELYSILCEKLGLDIIRGSGIYWQVFNIEYDNWLGQGQERLKAIEQALIKLNEEKPNG